MKIARNKTAQQGPGRGYLDGQMLIAMPAMNDERFSRAVIYVCAHSTEGAMGIIVNHPAANIKFPDLLVQLEVIPAAERIQLPERAEEVKVLKGGPVETGRHHPLATDWIAVRSRGVSLRPDTTPTGYRRHPDASPSVPGDSVPPCDWRRGT